MFSLQSSLTEQVQTSQKKIRALPIEQNENFCRVTRTICLACLQVHSRFDRSFLEQPLLMFSVSKLCFGQNVFPGGKQWNKSGSGAETHSSYVKVIYISTIKPSQSLPCNPQNPSNVFNLCNPFSMKDYVERILQPVFTALSVFPTITQQTVDWITFSKMTTVFLPAE